MYMVSELRSLIPETFTPVPSLESETIAFRVVSSFDRKQDALGIFVSADGDLPDSVHLSRQALKLAGFEAKPGQVFVASVDEQTVVYLVGIGEIGERCAQNTCADTLRQAAAEYSRAAQRAATLSVDVRVCTQPESTVVGQAIAEGIILGRYRYDLLKNDQNATDLTAVDILVGSHHDLDAVEQGCARGVAMARATTVARDLANTPPAHLTATAFGEIASAYAKQFNLSVEVLDRAAIKELKCGGVLGVNAGSNEEPRIIKLHYRPAGTATENVVLVGKGIMYDSGGISLKPSDPSHLMMKMDMSGAAAVFGALTSAHDLGSTVEVTAFLLCTDNMPSGSAYKLGDVLTARNGKTVEVKNTDAEGRLVLMDGLSLGAELHPDVMIDIATLTGSAQMSLGTHRAALFANDDELAERIKATACSAGELLWQMPLEKKYRAQLDSEIADMSNIGGKYAGATTAALFLQEFVGDIPWAHIDIAGTMHSDTHERWLSPGSTGFGARLLATLLSPKA